MIESTALRYFREVTLRGSIKRAAESLRIAPSAISRQVQGLEDELSAKLFERGARGMSLTGAGHLLHRYAVESQDKLDRIRAQVEEFELAAARPRETCNCRGPARDLCVRFRRRPCKRLSGHLDHGHDGGYQRHRRKGRTARGRSRPRLRPCATARSDRVGAHASVIVPDGRHPIIRWPAESTAR